MGNKQMNPKELDKIISDAESMCKENWFLYANGECFDSARLLALVAELKSMKERTTPKMAKNSFNYGQAGICPTCYAVQQNKRVYCYNCGQKLDWEEDAE